MAGGPLAGCVVLRLPQPNEIWPPPSPPPPQDPGVLGLYLTLALLLLLLILVGFWARRAWRQAGEGMPLDSEDQALLRTARDALVFVIKRRLKRARLVVVGKR
ncbi:MAG: hypothetical protein KJ720_07545 [Proteobacteria bacterium]|nr:hypothetical protein [Pseudomonadota bacterium]MBU1452283.1 hypothetical protein [Pseudomonadota bacterium]MBU2470005.1 hypothetical protein [Pseudomonadota bacterium]MBU2519456.1 hypothetical protein [Pseudomonadota bacterium]